MPHSLSQGLAGATTGAITRGLKTGAILAVSAVMTVPSIASAQWFGFGRNRCEPCAAPPPAYTAYNACDACSTQTVSIAAVSAPVVQQTACVAVQPVRQTVYQQVPVTKYRKVAKTERRPVYKTAYEDREVTVMQQVTEQRTVNQPYTTYQSVTQYRPQSQDFSRWQTVYRPNCKVSPCDYDRRPGFVGWMNRTRKEFTNAFTPDRVATRQYIPDVRTAMVPVTHQVPVTATRQVTYNVAKMVPVKQKQRVAVLRQEYEDVPVTAYEPYTEMQTVAVGSQLQMAYVSPGGLATAAAPTPTRSASNDQRTVPRKASNNDTGAKLQSYTEDEPSLDQDLRFDSRFQLPETPEPRVQQNLNVKNDRNADTPVIRLRDPRALSGYRPRRRDVAQLDGWKTRQTPQVMQMAGWKPVRPQVDGPNLNVAMND